VKETTMTALRKVSLDKVKLGTNQLGVLRSLRDHGKWYGSGWGCGWAWSTKAKTELILDSLVRRGLVAKAIETTGANRTAMVWRPTEAGLALVAK
jgi:hypothetical protein